MAAATGLRGLPRLNGRTRLAGIDLARGLAVLGMLAAHLLVTADEWRWTDATTWLSVVDGRSSILFATLAGVSMGLVTGGAEPLAELGTARRRLAVRAGLLWTIGVLLVLTGVPVFVILPAYALLFLLALPFLRLRALPLLSIAAGVALTVPFVLPWVDGLAFWRSPFGADIADAIGWHYPSPLWIAFVLAGLACARAGLDRRTVQGRMLLGGAAASALGYGAAALIGSAETVWSAAPHSGGLPEAIGSGGFAVALTGACLLLCPRGASAIGWATLPLRAVGAMPLTAYTVQLAVWAVVASAVLDDAGDLTGFRALDPFWPLTLGIVAGCTLWAMLIGRGPLEWGSDRLARLLVPSR